APAPGDRRCDRAPSASLPVGPERTTLVEPIDFTGDRAALAGEEVAHGGGEAGVGDEVHAVGGRRLEAAQVLPLAAGARLETLEPAADAVIDGGVGADVRGEGGGLPGAAPGA